MRLKRNNRGVTLLELIVAISIMVILVSVVAPMMVKWVHKAKQAKIEKEASEFIKAAQVAYIEVHVEGKEPVGDSVKNKTSPSSPYYKNGTRYGNLTNWTVHNGVVAGASNGPFAEKLFDILGISYGKGWKSKRSTIPIAESQPKQNPAGSLTKECIFQVFYNAAGDIILEYSRNGYFVRMENSVIVDSVKIKDKNQKLFTTWQ